MLMVERTDRVSSDCRLVESVVPSIWQLHHGSRCCSKRQMGRMEVANRVPVRWDRPGRLEMEGTPDGLGSARRVPIGDAGHVNASLLQRRELQMAGLSPKRKEKKSPRSRGAHVRGTCCKIQSLSAADLLLKTQGKLGESQPYGQRGLS